MVGANAEAEANRRERIAVFMVEGGWTLLQQKANEKERMLDGPVDVSFVNTFECLFWFLDRELRRFNKGRLNFKISLTYVTHSSTGTYVSYPPASSERNPLPVSLSHSLATIP